MRKSQDLCSRNAFITVHEWLEKEWIQITTEEAIVIYSVR